MSRFNWLIIQAGAEKFVKIKKKANSMPVNQNINRMFEEVCWRIFGNDQQEKPNYLVEINCQEGKMLAFAYDFLESQNIQKNRGFLTQLVALTSDPSKIDIIRKDLGCRPHNIFLISDARADIILKTLGQIGDDVSNSSVYLQVCTGVYIESQFQELNALKCHFGVILFEDYSHLLDISPSHSLMARAQLGWFPKEGSCFFDKQLQSTLIHFEERPYFMRLATLSDLKPLKLLERMCRPKGLQMGTKELRDRIEKYPEGQIVLQSHEDILGVLYSQRLYSIECLREHDSDSVEKLHEPNGSFFQILALNITPTQSEHKLSEEFLEFVLQKASLTPDLTHVFEMVPLSEYPGAAKISIEEYLKNQTDPALHMHLKHGTKVRGAIPDYYSSFNGSKEGYGVLIIYPLKDRLALSVAPFVEMALEHIRLTHLFDEFSLQSLTELASLSIEKRFSKGDIIIRQGEIEDQLYILLSGRLAVSQLTDNGKILILGDLRPHEFFGEMALLTRSPRSATISAIEDCQVLMLYRQDVETFFYRHPSFKEKLQASLKYRRTWEKNWHLRPSTEQLYQILVAATGCMDRAVLQTIEPECEWIALPRGTLLIRQGEVADCLYIILKGHVKAFGYDQNENQVTIAELGAGESVGEMALFSRNPRSSNVEVTTDSELLRLSKAGFDRLILEQPQVMAAFMRNIVNRLSRMTNVRNSITHLRSMPLITLAECTELIWIENPVLQNLQITQMYHRLSLEIALMIGQQDANWCTFACRASKTAGYSIRQEVISYYELMIFFRRFRIGRWCCKKMNSTLNRAGINAKIDSMLDAISRAISAGNLKVYAELAPVFSTFAIEFHNDLKYDASKLERFLATLKSGPTDQGGQGLLAEALSCYYEAMFEPILKRKTELILLANVKIGLHEQTRLQPNIVEALNKPLSIGLDGLVAKMLVNPIRWLLPHRAALAIERFCMKFERRIVKWTTAYWRVFLTRSMMTIHLPYGDIRLGRDVPRLPTQQLFPDVLQKIELKELKDLINTYQEHEDTLLGSHASDWGNLDDRMCFIIDLFRSRQKSLELFDEPFLYEQRLELGEGLIPKGRL